MVGATPLDVVASISPLAEMVERVGGNGVSVRVILPPGAAPETWAPTPAQALALARADLFVGVGHPLMALESRYLTPLAASARNVERLTLSDPGGSGLGSDPHLWMDLDRLASTAERLAQWLLRRQPERAMEIEAALRDYLDEIASVDLYLRALLAVPGARPVVFQHSAWERLLERYGVPFITLESKGKEPTPAELVRLISRARQEGVGSIFVQLGVSDRAARLVAQEIDAELIVLDATASSWLATLRSVGESMARARL